MSNGKEQWSEKQPGDWLGEPLGTESGATPPEPLAATPPSPPPPVVVPSKEGRFNVSEALSRAVAVLKSDGRKMLRNATLWNIPALIISLIAANYFASTNKINQVALQALVNGEFPEDYLDGVTTEAQLQALLEPFIWLGGFVFIVTITISIVQFIALQIASARALSRMSDTPEVESLKIPWAKLISANLFTLFIVMLILIPIVASAVLGFYDLALLLTPLVLAAAIWIAIGLTLLSPHVIVSNTGGSAAFRETLQLARSNRWRTIAVLLISGLAVTVVSVALSIFTVISDDTSSTMMTLSVYAVSQVITSIVTIPISASAVSAMYVTRRRAK